MSDKKPPLPQQKSASPTGGGKASLADLIAQTPGAQPREQLRERIKARQQARAKKKQKPVPNEEQLTTPEPMPFVHQPNVWAAGLLERFKSKEFPKPKQKPPKRSTPRVIINNDKPKSPKKK